MTGELVYVIFKIKRKNNVISTPFSLPISESSDGVRSDESES